MSQCKQEKYFYILTFRDHFDRRLLSIKYGISPEPKIKTTDFLERFTFKDIKEYRIKIDQLKIESDSYEQ